MILRRTWSRGSLYGEMAETITATPLRVKRFATNPILSTFMLRSSRLKPRPLERFVLTMSPSSTSTRRPLSLSSFSTISAMVVLPAPESPVNHNVNPRSNLPFSILKFSVLCEFALLAVYLGPHALDEDLDNLGAAELRR